MCSDTVNERKLSETPWMTVEEAAAYLSVSPGTVRNWVSQRYVPFVRRGHVVRFNRHQLDQWLSHGACKGRIRKAPAIGRPGKDKPNVEQGGLDHEAEGT